MKTKLTQAKRLIEAFVTMLVGRRVAVTWRLGGPAALDASMQIINLPAPTTGDDDEVALLTRLAMHEAGHMTCTEPGWDVRLDDHAMLFFNALEDPRMERQQTTTYPGAQLILARGLAPLLTSIEARAEEVARLDPMRAVCTDLLLRGFIKLDLHDAIRDKAPTICNKLAPCIAPAQRRLMDAALADLANATTSRDCERIAAELAHGLRELQDQQTSDDAPPDGQIEGRGAPDGPVEQPPRGDQHPVGKESGDIDQSDRPGDGSETKDTQRQVDQSGGEQSSGACGNEGEQPGGGETNESQQQAELSAAEQPSGADADEGDRLGDRSEISESQQLGGQSAGEQPGGAGANQGDQPGSGQGGGQPGQQTETRAADTSRPAGDAGEGPGSGGGTGAKQTDVGNAEAAAPIPTSQIARNVASTEFVLPADPGEPVDLGTLLKQAHHDHFGESAQAGTEDEAEITDAELQAVQAAMRSLSSGEDLAQVLERARIALAAAQAAGEPDSDRHHAQAFGAGGALASDRSTINPLEDNRSGLESVQARLVAVLLREYQERKRQPRRPQSEGGRVLAHRFWRLSAVGDTAIFAGRKQVAGMDAATSILIDRSGSMEKTLAIAVDSAMAFSLALQRLNLQTRIVAFPGRDDWTTEVQRFGESARAAMPRSRELIADGGTPMGEAMATELVLLQQQRQLKKTMVVISDGEPNADSVQAVQASVAYATNNGISLLGIGIAADIRSSIADAVTINNVTELPQALEDLFRSRMLTKLAA